MNDFRDSLDRIKSICTEIISRFESPDVTESIKALQESVTRGYKSWSGSWIGYHSRVYYKDLQPIPPGARFSHEWGFSDSYFMRNTGEWREYTFDYVYNFLKSASSSLSLDKLKEISTQMKMEISDLPEELTSIICSCLANGEDEYLRSLKNEAEACEVFSLQEFIDHWRPKQLVSRDMLAFQSGAQTPPHIYLRAELLEIQSPALVAKRLMKIANRLSSHLINKSRIFMNTPQLGTHIFIGHGRSLLWREFKDFISDKLKLPWDEFNRVPVAGVANTIRLNEMLDKASMAFLIMTAEDEQGDGKLRARMNVIHEAGLFQGRLGFARAIILLEDSCESFSNVDGLGYISFPRGNIKACFEDVRNVLGREGLV